jgi:hypothetical protein
MHIHWNNLISSGSLTSQFPSFNYCRSLAVGLFLLYLALGDPPCRVFCRDQHNSREHYQGFRMGKMKPRCLLFARVILK